MRTDSSSPRLSLRIPRGRTRPPRRHRLRTHPPVYRPRPVHRSCAGSPATAHCDLRRAKTSVNTSVPHSWLRHLTRPRLIHGRGFGYLAVGRTRTRTPSDRRGDEASHAAAGVLTGPRGVGKTRIAGEALNRCEGAEARWTAGTPAGRAVPLGAFVDWVPDGVENPTHSMERVIAHLVGGATQRSVVVVVDDVHLLDDASASCCTASSTADSPKCCSPRAPVSRSRMRWLRCRGQPSYSVSSSRSSATRKSASLLASALGGAVDPVVARRLWTLTQGNVRYLRSLVEHHVRSGQLRRADGMWTFRLGTGHSRRSVRTRRGGDGQTDR